MAEGARMGPGLGEYDWPFFEERHRRFVHDLDVWAGKAAIAELAEADEAGVDEACRMMVRRMGAGGWLTHAVPFGGAEGGAGLDVRTLCLARETLARHGGLADFAFAMQGLGSAPITLFGTQEQKRRHLPPVARGETIAAFALSEAEAGSDVAALATSAERDGADYVLNGEKTWISNAGIAGLYTVLARTGEAPGARGLTAFIVPADTPGFEVTQRIAVTAPHPLGTLRFEDCRVPESARLGEAGQGFKIAMATLDVFRSTVGAAALGLARHALDATLARARSRALFGGTLGDLQIVQGMLADMAVDVETAALLVYRAAWRKDSGAARISREAAMAKLHATEAAQRVIDAAVQLHGGLGVVAGHAMEKLYREVRALRIYEGASEVQKVIVARQLLGDGK